MHPLEGNARSILRETGNKAPTIFVGPKLIVPVTFKLEPTYQFSHSTDMEFHGL